MPKSFRKSLLPLMLAILYLGPGCVQTRVTSSTWDQWRQLEWFDPNASGVQSGSAGRGNRGYTVELGKFTGQDTAAKTYRLITTARQEAGLANLWYASSGQVTTVYAGKFRDRDSAEARAVLREARAARVDGQKLFDDPELVSITSARSEIRDKRDLRTLSGRGLYALQIGYFDRGYGPNYRKAAEDAVDALRDEDEEAYYFHGPNRSMVLIKSWTYNQAFTQVLGRGDRYSNTVRELQEKYPHNVPNGQPFTAADDPDFVASQKSFLIPIR